MIDISITSNTSEVIKYLKAQAKIIESKRKANLVKVGKYLVRASRNNAPYKDGQLRRDIKYIVDGDTVIIFVSGKSEAYATEMHDGHYRRGRGTIRKGAQAGRKYISRAIDDGEDKIGQILGDF